LYLFIFESIGTQELILIGIVALIFLGPRKLPEYARKIGKMMNEFRSTTNEFKATWEREVNFEEEAKALQLGTIDEEAEKPVPRENSILESRPPVPFPAPEVRELDAEKFGSMRPGEELSTYEPDENAAEPESDKGSWL